MTSTIRIKNLAILIICVAIMACALACYSPHPELVPVFNIM